MLEEYSAGRVLTVRAEGIKRIKRGKKSVLEEELEYGSEVEEPVEKLFTFLNELADLVNYNVISNYCLLLKDLDILHEKSLTSFITSFFGRVMNQLKAEWVFFQVDYLNIFNMLLHNTEVTTNIKFNPLIDLIKKIISKFFQLGKTNHLLFIEALFRIPSHVAKDEILSNYEGFIEFEQNNRYERQKEIINWSKKDDALLIENYFNVKMLENCYELLSDILQDPLKTKDKVFLLL
jgi:timeless